MLLLLRKWILRPCLNNSLRFKVKHPYTWQYWLVPDLVPNSGAGSGALVRNHLHWRRDFEYICSRCCIWCFLSCLFCFLSCWFFCFLRCVTASTSSSRIFGFCWIFTSSHSGVDFIATFLTAGRPCKEFTFSSWCCVEPVPEAAFIIFLTFLVTFAPGINIIMSLWFFRIFSFWVISIWLACVSLTVMAWNFIFNDAPKKIILVHFCRTRFRSLATLVNN